MSFIIGLIFGVVIGLVLHDYLPSGWVNAVKNLATGWSDNLKGPKPAASSTETPPAAKKKPSAVAKRQSADVDDLKKIEGIGPKIASLLNADGITKYKDLASTDLGRLKSILEKAGSRYRIADPTTWPKQAMLAGNADWDGLKALKAQLKGGR